MDKGYCRMVCCSRMNLTDNQIKKIERIARDYNLKFVLLFGSRTSDFLHAESDFDIAYLSTNSLTFDDEYHFNYELTKVFGSDRVDTVDLKKAGPLLMHQIFENHQVLYCADRTAYYRYRIYAIKRFIEAKPIFKFRDQLIHQYFTANR